MDIDSALLDDILNQVYRGVAAPTITGPFLVSLHTGAPGTTRANEVSTAVWTNYARASIARSTGAWAAAGSDGAGGREVSNAAIADYGTAAITGTSPVVTHVEVWDSAGSPRRIGGIALTSSKTIDNGDPVTFPIGALEFAFAPAA